MTDLPSPAPPSDRSSLSAALWDLLAKQTARYTMGESSSIPVETAQELLDSLCFTLGLACPPEAWPNLSVDGLEAAYDRGLRALEQKRTGAKGRWRLVRLTLPSIATPSLRETLDSIGIFFHRYDPRFFSHQIPCDINYQLCQPVPNVLLGVDYVNEYLRRLQLENLFLSRFPPGELETVLERNFPGHTDTVLNLFEPAAVNALGHALLGLRDSPLPFDGAGRRRAASLLVPLSEAEVKTRLQAAARALCPALGLSAPALDAYLLTLAAGLFPRLKTALTHGALESMFL